MSASRLIVSAIALAISATSHAAIIGTYSVGAGANSASIQIDQEDGDGYLFNVHWDAATFTSWNALVEIDTALETLWLTYEDHSWGIFITGITVDGDTDHGTGDQWPIENYWHFWLHDHDTGAWEQAMFGPADRALFNGAQDAWVFGSAIAPQSVPAPGALAITLSSLAVCRGRSRSGHTRASRVH